jgi:hypothetical protein
MIRDLNSILTKRDLRRLRKQESAAWPAFVHRQRWVNNTASDVEIRAHMKTT